MFNGNLSVFFPAYNEEKNIRKTVTDAVRVLNSLKLKKWELIIIDDGSKDKTGEISDQLTKEFKEIRVIHQSNGGYGEAVKTGLYNSKLDWIFFTDSDGQFDFSEIKKLIEQTDSADIVVGYRVNRQDSWNRKLNGWGWTLISNLLLGINVKDVDCAFKLIDSKVIKEIPRLESTRGGMVNPELLAKAKKKGFKITQVGVHHYPRTAGEQTGSNLNVIFQSFRDLFRLWRKLA